MSTLEQWQEDSVKQFENDCRDNGDLLWKPMTQNDRESIMEAVKYFFLYFSCIYII